MIRSYNVVLSHEDWTLLTDKYDEEDLRVLMKIRTPSFEKMEEKYNSLGLCPRSFNT